MKIFQPELEDQDEGYATSFTFDNLDEQSSFASFLENMGIGYLKSKFPVRKEDRLFSMFEYFLEQEVIPNLP